MQIDSVHFHVVDLLFISRSFPVELLGYTMYIITSSVNRDSLTSFFLSLYDFNFLLLPYLSIVLETAQCWKRVGDSGHPCVIPDFSGIASSLFPFRMMLAGGSSCIAIIMVRYGPFSSIVSKNFTWRHVEFYLRLFLYYLEDHEIFVLKFIFSVYYIYWHV